MVRELKRTGELTRKDIIVTAKHGQSPVDPSKLAKIGHKEGSIVTSAGIDIAQLTDDDIALMWLSDQRHPVPLCRRTRPTSRRPYQAPPP